MNNYARSWKSSRGWGGHNFLFNFNLIFFCISKRGAISAMHVQRMYYSATYFQLSDGTGSEPLTRDPTRPDPDTFWPVDPTRSPSVCALNWDYFDVGVLQVNAFCQKSLVCAAHIQITTISNIIVSLFSTEK